MKNIENLTDKQIDIIETIITSFEKSNEKKKAVLDASPIDALFIKADLEEQRRIAWYQAVEDDNNVVKAHLENALIRVHLDMIKLFENYNLIIEKIGTCINVFAAQDDGTKKEIHKLGALGNTYYRTVKYDNSPDWKAPDAHVLTGFKIGYHLNKSWDHENIAECPIFMKCVEDVFFSSEKYLIKKIK
jgi:hypothetical protein